MVASFRLGECVRLADGRIGRVRGIVAGKYRVRVRRPTSTTHQFLVLTAKQLKRVACPKGWMSVAGYVRYLRTTLRKMKQRQKRGKDSRPRQRGAK